MLVLRETWQAADPDVPLGDDSLERAPVHPVLWVWWVALRHRPAVVFAVTSGCGMQLGSIGADDEDIAKSFVDNSGRSTSRASSACSPWWRGVLSSTCGPPATAVRSTLTATTV